jgi:hypothetical protein
VRAAPVYCTKIASKLCRTYTDRHGLKYLLDEMLGIDISKQQQMSDWGAEALTEAQLSYAASDVLYLHRLKERLDHQLAREGRTALAAGMLPLPARAGRTRPQGLARARHLRALNSSAAPISAWAGPRGAAADGSATGPAMSRLTDSRTRVVTWLKVLLPLVALGLLSTLFLLARTADPTSRSAIPTST